MDISENQRRCAGDPTLRLGNSEAPSQSSRIASTSGGSKDEGERFQLLKRAVALSIFTNIGANFGRAFRLIASLSDEAIYFGCKSLRAIYFGCKSRRLDSSQLSRLGKSDRVIAISEHQSLRGSPLPQPSCRVRGVSRHAPRPRV